MYRTMLCALCAMVLSGCATSRYDIAVTSLTDEKGGWVAVRVDEETGEASYYRSPSVVRIVDGKPQRTGGQWFPMK